MSGLLHVLLALCVGLSMLLSGMEAGVFGQPDPEAVEVDREDEGGEEDAERHRQGPGEAARQVADEGGEDDQRRRQDAADREAVDELAVGQPVMAVDGAVLEEGDHRVGAAEGEQAGLQSLEEDRRGQRDRDRPEGDG